ERGAGRLAKGATRSMVGVRAGSAGRVRAIDRRGPWGSCSSASPGGRLAGAKGPSADQPTFDPVCARMVFGAGGRRRGGAPNRTCSGGAGAAPPQNKVIVPAAKLRRAERGAARNRPLFLVAGISRGFRGRSSASALESAFHDEREGGGPGRRRGDFGGARRQGRCRSGPRRQPVRQRPCTGARRRARRSART